MAYKCVHCSKLYEDGSEEVLNGCSSCGRKFFFYIRKEQLEKIKETEMIEVDLSSNEKKQIDKDVREISGFEDEETPVDLTNLFSTEKPRVYKLEDGKYIVDLAKIRHDI